MKIILIIILIMSLTLHLSYSQVTESEKILRSQPVDSVDGWKKGITLFLNLTQISLTNWAAGGENSFSANGLISSFVNYKKNSSIWDNSLDIGYGLLKQGDNKKFIKTDDKIDFLSKYGQKSFKNWYYSAMINFKTQFTAGYNYPNDSVKISDFFVPAYLLGALGLDHKPGNKFSLFIAPVTTKFTFVNNQKFANAGAFGVTPAKYDTAGTIIEKGKKFRAEFGGYVRAVYKIEPLENILITTKIDLFSNYVKNPQNVDVNWETQFVLKANKYFSTTLATQLIYDDDVNIEIDSNNDGVIDKIGPRVQFKELLAISFSLKF